MPEVPEMMSLKADEKQEMGEREAAHFFWKKKKTTKKLKTHKFQDSLGYIVGSRVA